MDLFKLAKVFKILNITVKDQNFVFQKLLDTGYVRKEFPVRPLDSENNVEYLAKNKCDEINLMGLSTKLERGVYGSGNRLSGLTYFTIFVV